MSGAAEKTRQKRPTEEGKRYPLNMRTTKEIREKLEIAAARSGRSLAQEVENRIERSLLLDDEIGPSARHLLEMIRFAVSQAEASAGAAWHEDHNAWGIVKIVVNHILDTNQPPLTSDVDPQVVSLRHTADRANHEYEEARSRFAAFDAKRLAKAQKLADYFRGLEPEEAAKRDELARHVMLKAEEAAHAAQQYNQSLDPHVNAEDRANAALQQIAEQMARLFKISK